MAERTGLDARDTRLPSRKLWIVAGLGLLAFIALRLVSIQRIAFNWDEFGFFDSVARTLADGRLRTGGRPGLAQLLALPAISDCTNEITVARALRTVWLAINLIGLAGLFTLLLELFRDRVHRVHDAALGVALLAFLPVFLEWSIQVRTDHIAITGGLWGGVALLKSERTRGLAFLAGICFAVGWLSSQKLLYIASLMGVLAIGHTALTSGFEHPRDSWRLALLVSGVSIALLCYRAIVLAAFTLPETHPAIQILTPELIRAHTNPFAFYRGTIGFSQYAQILPTLLPHIALGIGLIASLSVALSQEVRDRSGVLALAVVILGFAVGLIHAAAFSYFWLSLGLFPAIAGALAVESIRTQLLSRRAAWVRPAGVALWIALAIPAVWSHVTLLENTQRVQAESLAFLNRNFEGRGGFHPEGARFCGALHPSGLWYSQTIWQRFENPNREAHIAKLISQMRQQPSHYLVESFRLGQFPQEVQEFWAQNFQPYRDSVFIAGRRLDGTRGLIQPFELIVSGRYRWVPFDEADAVRIDGTRIAAGQEIELEATQHLAEVPQDANGILVLAVDVPPGPTPLAFYKAY